MSSEASSPGGLSCSGWALDVEGDWPDGPLLWVLSESEKIGELEYRFGNSFLCN